MQGNSLVAYKSSACKACCHIQSEAMALEEAINWIQKEGFTECTFKTDCQTLSNAADDLQSPTGMEWRSFT